MDKKYAQEPWTISRNRVCGEGKVICRMETSYTGFGNMSDGKWTSDKDKVKATEKRIVECVNACEGIADPSAVKDMQETLLTVVRRDGRTRAELESMARAALDKAEGRL